MKHSVLYPSLALMSIGAAAFNTTAARAQTISTVVAQNSGKCLDVNAFSSQTGLPMQQYTCNQGNNQSFKFIPTTAGSYTIQAQNDSLCLDVASNGWQVVQNACNGSSAQNWKVQAANAGAYQVISNSGSCLNVSGQSKQNSGNMILFGCSNDTNEQFLISGLVPPTTSAHVPTGITGSFTPIIDATFGTGQSDATVKNRADLDKLAYYWFEYGPADTDPPFWARSGAPDNCMGPTGDGTDGLYGNFESRFMHCDSGSKWDRHVLSSDRLTLKASCGLQDGNTGNCSDGNIGGGMLRFIKSFRASAANPIVVEMKGIMPKGMYSWPAFWLNPGEQNPRNADGTPGSFASPRTWPPEIDVFDNFGYNGTLPGHYLLAGANTNKDDATYASALCNPQSKSVCDLPLTPGGDTLPTTSVASFAAGGWYATTNADLTADWHVYSAHIFPDHIEYLLDGVVYRSIGYTWPTTSAAMQLLVSNQTAAKFNDLTGIVDQGGVANGWDWAISYIRVWQQN